MLPSLSTSTLLTSVYPFALPPLPYGYGDLEPYIDEATMRYHHDKHFAAYVNNLNAALKPYPHLQGLTLRELLTNPLPEAGKTAILRNAGGSFNHDFYFKQLKPLKSLKPDEGRRYVDPDVKAAVSKTALDVFGSGYGCLARKRSDSTLSPTRTTIFALKDQETVIGLTGGEWEPVVMIDVWEHAYYLKHKNDRAGYVDDLWNLIYLPTSTPA